MQTAVPVGQGAMAAILGLDLAAVQAVVAEAAAHGVVAAANDNDPAQVVISGETAAVAAAAEKAKAAGARRAMMLPVSAPFHCALMKPAADEMAEALAQVTIAAPAVPVVSNVSAEGLRDPDRIRTLLVAQVTGAVRWRESVSWMAAQGVDAFWEIGAGKALSGMVRRIAKDASTRQLGSTAEVRAAAGAASG
jgi:[acyl-carrier-protein] S-malonyltransferase